MENIKVCPHCGGQQFMAYIKRGGLVESVGIDDNGNPQFRVIKEGAKTKYELEIIRCSSCQADVKESDLIGGVPCKTCGKLMNPSTLDENGNCEVCAMLVSNPQLKNASQDDLLRMLARAMKGMKPDTALVEQKQAQAEAVEANLAPTPVEIPEQQMSAADAILSGGTIPDAATAAAPKRGGKKRGVRRAEEANPPVEQQEPPVVEAPAEAEQVQAEQDLANSQTAPFPDIEGIGMNPVPVGQPEAPVEPPTPVGAGFKMFDGADDEEPF